MTLAGLQNHAADNEKNTLIISLIIKHKNKEAGKVLLNLKTYHDLLQTLQQF